MGILETLGIKKKDVDVVTPVSEKLIKTDEVIKSQAMEIQALKAQIARDFAEKKEEPSEEDEKVQGYIEDINEQYDGIVKERFGKTFSHRQFWAAIFGVNPDDSSPFGEDIELTDKDDEIVFGKFKDILNLPGSHIGITTTENRLLVHGSTMDSIIWKPDSLNNHLKRKRLPLAMDKEGNHVPDIESEEVPDIVYDEKDNIWKETIEFRKQFKDHLKRRDIEIQELRKEIQRTEGLLIESKSIIDDLKRQNRMLISQNETVQTSISDIMSRDIQRSKIFHDMQTQINLLTEYKVFKEKETNGLYNIIDELQEKIEDDQSKSKYDRILAQLKDDGMYWNEMLREKAIIPIETPAKLASPNMPVGLPGQPRT